MALFLPGDSGLYFEMPEANLGTSARLSPVQFTLGRKLETWSHLDEFWKLGIWQPRYRWDYLNPETVGLTGGFLSVNLPGLRLVGFASNLYIPERGVPINSNGGQLTSASPWFLGPPSYVSLDHQYTPLNYNLEIPAIRDIVWQHQPSVSFMAQLGSERGWWGSAAYAHKPMNQLLLAYGGKFQIIVNRSSDVVDVPVAPRVVYHSLGSIETGFRSQRFNFWFSTLWDVPGADPTAGIWVYQQVRNSFAWSPGIDWTIWDRGEQPTKLTLSYLRQTGGNAPDYSADPNAPTPSDLGSVFEDRYPFQSAISLGGITSLSELAGPWARHLTLSGQMLLDLGHQGAIFTADMNYRPYPSWELSFGADVLGTYYGPLEAVSTTDFISRYQSNDRVRWGLTYVF